MHTLMAIAAMTLLSAQTETEITEPDQVVYKTKTFVDFSKLEISGEVIKPEGSYLPVRRGSRFRSLIKIRHDFRPELEASLDSL